MYNIPRESLDKATALCRELMTSLAERGDTGEFTPFEIYLAICGCKQGMEDVYEDMAKENSNQEELPLEDGVYVKDG